MMAKDSFVNALEWVSKGRRGAAAAGSPSAALCHQGQDVSTRNDKLWAPKPRVARMLLDL